MNRVLARTDDVAVALLGLQVYSTGVTFDLILRVSPSAAGRLPVAEVLMPHRPGPTGGSRFLVGVQFADGRRVSSLDTRDSDAELVFTPRSSSSGDTGGEQSWWLNPLPPDGPLRLVIRCPELGIAETSTELDATSIRRAAADVVTLWPWAMPAFDEPPGPPPTPQVPPDSWFAR